MNTSGCVGEIASQGVVPCCSFISRQLGNKFSRFIAQQQQGRDGDYIVNHDSFKKWLETLCSDQ
jgi:hypothetical protein